MTKDITATQPGLAEADTFVPEEQEVLGQYIPLQYHYNMLQDEDRIGAFREAIELCVRPGMHVVELGGGTGILSSFAARMGATVSCVERNQELATCARRFVYENGLQGQVDVIHADATDFVPSSPVDAVVCEMLHVGLLREKQAEVIDAFKRNYINAFGPRLPLFLPETSILMCQPVQQNFEFAGYYAAIPMFQAPIVEQPRTVELAALNPYANVCYEESIPQRFECRQSVTVNRSGTLNAIRLVTQNVIAVDLTQQKAMTWPNQCLVLPIKSPIEVTKGQSIDLAFSYPAGGTLNQLSAGMTVAPTLAPSRGQQTAAASNARCDQLSGKQEDTLPTSER